jgi:hypothetical protein
VAKSIKQDVRIETSVNATHSTFFLHVDVGSWIVPGRRGEKGCLVEREMGQKGNGGELGRSKLPR